MSVQLNHFYSYVRNKRTDNRCDSDENIEYVEKISVEFVGTYPNETIKLGYLKVKYFGIYCSFNINLSPNSILLKYSLCGFYFRYPRLTIIRNY